MLGRALKRPFYGLLLSEAIEAGSRYSYYESQKSDARPPPDLADRRMDVESSLIGMTDNPF